MTDAFSSDLTLLHLAPDPCLQQMLFSASNIRYVSADLDLPLAMVKLDITAMPFQRSAFDALLCVHVLEHVPDDAMAMRELWRVLKPGGWAILQVPVDETLENTFEDQAIESPEERARAFGHRDHVRLYGRDYRDRLKNAGFSVKVDRYAKELSTEVVECYGLSSQEDVYFLIKTV